MGTKACENAPSANRRRNRLGMRKATQKASVSGPAPKELAIRMSRIRPVIRENRVKLLMVAADRNKLICVLFWGHANRAIQADRFPVKHFVGNNTVDQFGVVFRPSEAGRERDAGSQ